LMKCEIRASRMAIYNSQIEKVLAGVVLGIGRHLPICR
jgi:hypothetical protein